MEIPHYFFRINSWKWKIWVGRYSHLKFWYIVIGWNDGIILKANSVFTYTYSLLKNTEKHKEKKYLVQFYQPNIIIANDFLVYFLTDFYMDTFWTKSWSFYIYLYTHTLTHRHRDTHTYFEFILFWIKNRRHF